MMILPAAHEALRGLAAVAIVDGDVRPAARLIGAATGHRYGDPEDPVDARLHTTFFARTRARHGADAWTALLREGAALNFKDAVAYALQEPREERPSDASSRPATGYLTR
jgi:hypothetical protein